MKNFTIKLVVSLAFLLVANLYYNPLAAQEIKVYEGPYEKGHVKYHYYEDEQGKRVWHGDFNFKVQSSDFTHSVDGSCRHGAPHGNYARITTKEDTRRQDSSEKLVKDEDNATIIVDQDGNQKVAYGTKKATYISNYGSKAVRYIVKGKYYEGKKEGIWTIEDETGIETYEFNNGETTRVQS